MRRFQISLSEAKERLRIPAIWHHLALHGDPPTRGIGACASPFRPDRHPSFSLYDEGRRWKDHSTGEGGDAIDFVKRATGLDQRAATLRFLELVGLPAPPKVTYSKVETNAPSEPGNPNISRLGTPTQDEIRQIAQLRHLEPEALNGLAQHGILRTGRRFGFHVWALVDGPLGEAPRVAEVRRMDGCRLPSKDTPEGAKGLTLPGSRKDWPVGVSLLAQGSWKGVLLCEGMPDLLAAAHFAWREGRHDLCPVTMLGRANRRIHSKAIKLLEGFPMGLYPHADADGGGLAAMRRWAAQIPGSRGHWFDFHGLRKIDGKEVNDLNDCAHLHPDDEPELAGLLP